MPRTSAGDQLRDCRQVGARVAIIRQARGLTQEELAAATGRTRRAQAGIERGEWTVTDDDVRRFASVLKISPEWLLTGRRSSST